MERFLTISIIAILTGLVLIAVGMWNPAFIIGVIVLVWAISRGRKED